MPIRRHALALVALVIAVGACTSGGGAIPVEDPSASRAPVTAPPETTTVPAPAASASPSAAVSEGPSVAPTADAAAEALAARAWAQASLTDVTTGEQFRIADLAGKTIFVESMAIWCTNCRAQQGRFEEALAQLDRDTVAYVVLTVDPSESLEELARYREDRGFSGTYAVAGTALSRALVDDFGPNAINPPTVPLIHVTPQGEITFGTGGESVDEIIALARS